MFQLTNQQPSLAQLAYLEWQAEAELDRQKAIVRARQYYSGEQLTYLSARLTEILNLDGAVTSNMLFHMNVCKKVITAITERLSVTGFTSDEPDGVAPDSRQAQTAEDWWQGNRLDGKQKDIYRAVRRDGETFVIVDFADGEPRFTPHDRYTDATVGGTGDGCKAFYANGDTNQPLIYVGKRWTEDYTDALGRSHSRARMTLYFEDRIEKYELASGKWTPFVDLDAEGKLEEWPLPWIGLDGAPLGIAAIHFKNEELECDIDSSVVSLQNLLNKTLIDLAESSDQAAFRIYKAFGFIPTTDGKALASDGANRASVKPNTIIGSTLPPGQASFDAIPGESPDPLVTIIEKLQLWIARLKDIPASRFQISGQVAAEGTLKQQEAPLHALCEQLQIVLGDSWEDTFYLARRLANTFAGARLDETVTFDTQWAALDVRSDDRDDPVAFWDAADKAVTSGVPIKVFLKRMGWTDSDLAAIPDAAPAPGAQAALPPANGTTPAVDHIAAMKSAVDAAIAKHEAVLNA